MAELNCCGGLFKGSTPSIYFNTNAPLNNIKNIVISFYQLDTFIFDKANDDLEIIADKGRIKAKLSQADTLLLSAKFPIKVQLRISYITGVAVASQISEFNIEEVLKNEVI